METGPQSPSDNKFIASCRLHQSQYRAEILKEDYGYGPTKNSKKKFGNMLVDGEVTGSNFLSIHAFEFAKQKVLDKNLNKAMTIDEYRLFNNMLSSMPMCFNMFSDLRNLLLVNPEACTDIVKDLFAEIPWIDTVIYIDVEFIPVPISDFTNDKSAFDAMILVKDKEGKKGLISIETKYTDILGDNPSSDSEVKNKLVEQGKFFSDQLVAILQSEGYKQIHRNFLLTYAYAKKNGMRNFCNVVISPKADELSIKEIDDMKSNMIQFHDSIFKLSLEEFVVRGVNSGNKSHSELMQRFAKRYLV